MCNLNLLIKNIKEENEQLLNLASFMQIVTTCSYQNNNDGDGIYLNEKSLLLTSLRKLNLFKIVDFISASSFILSHQRNATSGLTSEYTQPFHNEEFVILHNGILHEFVRKSDNHSDTYNFFQDFIEVFKVQEHETREKRIIAAIKILLNNLDSAFYSIALFDKVEQKLYYFKESFAKIFFYKSKNYLYITTASENAKFLDMLEDGKFKEKKVKDYVIYVITNNREIRAVGEIKHKKAVVVINDMGFGGWDGYYNDYNDYSGKSIHRYTC